MTKEDAEEFFGVVFKGKHNLPGKVRQFGSSGWTMCTPFQMATFDNDTLTRLVFHAHDAAVRVEIIPAGFYTRIAIWSRRGIGCLQDRHLRLGEALGEWRRCHSENEVESDTDDKGNTK